jgi:hypothetical protein
VEFLFVFIFAEDERSGVFLWGEAEVDIGGGVFLSGFYFEGLVFAGDFHAKCSFGGVAHPIIGVFNDISLRSEYFVFEFDLFRDGSFVVLQEILHIHIWEVVVVVVVLFLLEPFLHFFVVYHSQYLFLEGRPEHVQFGHYH